MLVHCVFLNFSDNFSLKERLSVLQKLGELVEEVEGMLEFRFGPNLDFENKTPLHREGFVVTFRDREAHLRYEQHPKHVELGKQLVEMCVGGANGILVYDISSSG